MQGDSGNFQELPIIDKQEVSHSYTADEAGEWIGISSRRVRQLSELHGIGKKTKRYWKYTYEELTILDTMHKSKRKMRDVTPKGVQAVADMMNSQDELFRYVADQFKRLRQETFALIRDVGRGNYNAMVKMYDRHEKAIFNMEMAVKELQYPKKKEERGRGGSTLGGLALLTLNDHEAEAA